MCGGRAAETGDADDMIGGSVGKGDGELVEFHKTGVRLMKGGKVANDAKRRLQALIDNLVASGVAGRDAEFRVKRRTRCRKGSGRGCQPVGHGPTRQDAPGAGSFARATPRTCQSGGNAAGRYFARRLMGWLVS
jgi:hypothetical protein